ncbi:MAG: MTH1187 family thiamine-binding protein [Candidatus Omnitrophica bacterium]|nr:MTH1187 family thiamine-binding protein [Candidatus Omnitrophota bacterium]
MLAELEILPVGLPGTSLSRQIATVAKLIDASGLDYRVGPMGTVVEGSWDQVVTLARRCHEAMLQQADRVLTTIRIDDRKDQPGPGRITSKVQSLEQQVGKTLRK